MTKSIFAILLVIVGVAQAAGSVALASGVAQAAVSTSNVAESGASAGGSVASKAGSVLPAASVEDGVFYRAETVGSSAHLRSVSVNFETPSFLEGSLGRCSATVVSSDGTLLTAKHCVAGCFARAVDPDGLPVRETGFGYSAGTEVVSGPCKGLFRGQPTEFEILAAGQATEIFVLDSVPYRTETLAAYRALRLRGFEESGDFALIRTPLARGLDCARVSFDSLVTGERLQSFGYPRATKRGRLDSDGHSQYVSFGRVLSGIADNPLARVSTHPLIDLQNMYDGLGLSFVTLDAEEGSSGGGVFDSDGRVVAIVDSMVGAPADVGGYSVTRVPGTTRVLSLAQIHSVLKQTMSDSQITELFKCAR